MLNYSTIDLYILKAIDGITINSTRFVADTKIYITLVSVDPIAFTFIDKTKTTIPFSYPF
jgi:hypothetical protein